VIASQRGRPIFAFRFYNELLIVALEVSNNGYIVGMNLKSRSLLEESEANEEDLNHWP
jgi:hypothetical protein